jgi:uncharacterized MAPEG superfamily protein
VTAAEHSPRSHADIISGHATMSADRESDMSETAPPGRFASNAIVGMVIGSAISLLLWAAIVVAVVRLT